MDNLCSNDPERVLYLFARCYVSHFRRELKDNLCSDDSERVLYLLLYL